MNKLLRPLGIFLLLLGLVLWGQQRSGAFNDEFGAHPDEAAHFVSALMIHDYLAQLGDEQGVTHPKKYAEDYYAHYPKVAIGNWPPGFHLLHAGWMLLLSPGQFSVFLLMAFFTAGLGLLIYLSAKLCVGHGWALVACLLLVVLPIIQEFYSVMMTEVVVAFLVFSAVLAYGRYVETRSWRWGLFFGVLASAAILVKGTGLVLGLVPPLAVIFLRRWSLLRTFGFWLPAIVVGLLCGPWYVYTMDIATDGWAESSPSIEFFARSFFYYLKKLVETGGPIICLMMFLGLTKTCFRRNPGQNSDEEKPVLFPMLGILFLSVPLFHCIVPAGMEHRHLIPMLPPFVIFTTVGMRELCDKLSTQGTIFEGRRAAWILGGVGLVGMFLVGEPIYYKGFSGYRTVIDDLFKVEEWPGPVLISSDASGEGMFVAEAALADSFRPSKTVVRATKALGESKWSGGSYKTTYQDIDGLRKLVSEGGYWAIVVDEAVSKARPDNYQKFAHMQDLEKLCQELQFAERFTIHRGGTEYGGDLVVYRNPRFAETDSIKVRETKQVDFSPLLNSPPQESKD